MLELCIFLACTIVAYTTQVIGTLHLYKKFRKHIKKSICGLTTYRSCVVFMRITPRKLKRVCLAINSEKEGEECVVSSTYKKII